MKLRNVIYLGVGIVSVICLDTVALAQGQKPNLDVRLGDPQKSYKVQGATASPAREGMFVGGYYTVAGSKPPQRTTWLWEIDSSCKRIQELDVTSIWNKYDLAFGFTDIALFSDDLLLATQNRKGEPILLCITTNGFLKYALPLAKKESVTVLRRIVLGAESTFFLLGSRGRSAVTYKLDSSGNILWEQSLETKKLDSLIDGVALPDGGLFAIRNSSEQVIPFGPCVLSIECFDAKGQSTTMASFPGRDGSLIRTSSGELILVYKEPPEEASKSTVGSKIRCKGFAADMRPVWTNTVTTIFRQFDTFSIYNVSTNYVIAGSTNRFAMWAIPVNERGELGQAVRGSEDEGSMGDKFRIISNNSGAYVVFSALGENIAQQEANKVAIMKWNDGTPSK